MCITDSNGDLLREKITEAKKTSCKDNDNVTFKPRTKKEEKEHLSINNTRLKKKLSRADKLRFIHLRKYSCVQA